MSVPCDDCPGPAPSACSPAAETRRTPSLPHPSPRAQDSHASGQPGAAQAAATGAGRAAPPESPPLRPLWAGLFSPHTLRLGDSASRGTAPFPGQPMGDFLIPTGANPRRSRAQPTDQWGSQARLCLATNGEVSHG